MTAFLRLFESRKAVLLLSLAGAATLVATKQVGGHEAFDFAKWLILVWLGGQAAVDAFSRRQPTEVPPEQVPASKSNASESQ